MCSRLTVGQSFAAIRKDSQRRGLRGWTWGHSREKEAEVGEVCLVDGRKMTMWYKRELDWASSQVPGIELLKPLRCPAVLMR